MCVIGNKVDLRDECREDRCVSTAEGEKLAKVRLFQKKNIITIPLPPFLPRCQYNLTAHSLPLQAYGALFCETSAKNGTNVVEAVLHLAR